jgi:hypothetical protein
VEEVVAQVMKVHKAIKSFQTMTIVSLNMGNLIFEVNTLKNILAVGGKEKAMLQKELDKERDFQKRYKHNVEIWRKNRVEDE